MWSALMFYITVFWVIILTDNYHLSLPTTAVWHVWVIGSAGYIDPMKELTGSGCQHLSDKILTFYLLFI
jgi:hypothetical protein